MNKEYKNNEQINFKIAIPDCEERATQDGEMVLEGYAAVFDRETVVFRDCEGNEYKEIIDRNAFNDSITEGCYLKYNHMNSALPLARVRGGSMELKADDYGLKFRATLFDTSYSRDVYSIVKSGGIDECSFAFSIAPDGDEYDRETRTRTIKSVGRLWDCAIVENPAYDGTSVSARSFFEAEAERERLESLKREEDEKKLELEVARAKARARILGGK